MPMVHRVTLIASLGNAKWRLLCAGSGCAGFRFGQARQQLHRT